MDVKCPGCFHITTVFSHAQVRIGHQGLLIGSVYTAEQIGTTRRQGNDGDGEMNGAVSDDYISLQFESVE